VIGTTWSMLACCMITTCTVFLDDYVVPASPKKLTENFTAKCDKETDVR
jgi:hypothetical protein